RLSIFVIAATIFVLGALAALLWPPTYKSSATILIKEQDIPSELVQSTVTSFASQRIQAISQKVMARPNLLEIIDKYSLYVNERKRLTTEEIIAEMRDNIGLDMIEAAVVDPRSGRPTSATIAFQLSFSGENPGQVQKVANELMSLYLQENLKERSEQANVTYVFLKKESERLDKEIAGLQAKLATFKEQHVNSLPELRQLNQSMMDRTEREISDIDNQIRAQEQTRVYLQSQLVQLKPFGANMELDPKTRLQALRTNYLSLMARYSIDHPDVIRAKREIEGLEKETGQVDSSAEQLRQIEALRGELATLSKKYSAEHPDVVKLERQIKALEQSVSSSPAPSKLASSAADNPDNPAYIQIQTQIEAIDTEIRSLRIKQADLKKRLGDYEQRLIETPQVEREYSSLQRDLQNSVLEHQSIRTKLTSAEIAQELEKDSKGERFVIIEPPILPEEPVSPNRPAILFLSFVLALGCGIGYAAIGESLDDTVRGSKSLSVAVGAAPLAVIPYLANDTEIRKHKHTVATRASAAAAAIVLAIAMLHYFWTPLDVLWYKALRKADIVVNT
ncbi:MAG: lipopolysaccharide biosynthesis protein, partial [Thermotogales bacterium]|nr:lipopolysaccharide biosynthesis protein [Thermotogales bacterium]